MTIESIKKQIVPILKREGVTKAALFGSCARGEMKKNSDIDVLIDLPRGKTLLDLVRMERVLEEKTGKEIDLLTYNGINPLLRDIILKDEKIIYEKESQNLSLVF